MPSKHLHCETTARRRVELSTWARTKGPPEKPSPELIKSIKHVGESISRTLGHGAGADPDPDRGACPTADGQSNWSSNWNLIQPVPLFARWQDMSSSKSPSDLGAVSRFAPRMPLLNPISTERSLYLS
jgi:hypothetical protein